MEFPPTRQLLADFVGQESHTLGGQRRKADALYNFIRRWELADAVQLVEYPRTGPYANIDPPQANVVFDIKGPPGGDTILWLGHYDTVTPKDYAPDTNPYQLTPDRDHPNVYHGLGCYDMLGGDIAFLRAAYQLKSLRSTLRHSVRCILVGLEEKQSQGIHAALTASHDIVGDISCCVSTDIPAFASLKDSPALYIGRPGRVGLRINVNGINMHAGQYRDEHFCKLASTRESLIKYQIPKIRFRERDEAHYRALMPPSVCTVANWASKDPESLSVPHQAHIDVDVLYGNPELDEVEIREYVQTQLQQILAREGIHDPDAVSVTREPGRVPPFTKPYLEHTGHTLVIETLEIMRRHFGQAVTLKAASGTADEPIIAHYKHVPTVIVAPRGQGEHTPGECVDINSIDNEVTPTLVDMACHPKPLTHT